MTRLATLVLVAALLPSLAWLAPACAQGSASGSTTSRAQAERNTIELKQGMTPDEVRELLGKPRRTALRSDGGSAAALQWTYVWSDARSSSSERSLSVEFAAKAAEEWFVKSWSWSVY
jgi:outer membrane protein assembly factor BamE (lipoprotein component of BamABCDE complex)